MAPGITIDNVPDFDPESIISPPLRILLLAPPSISSHEDKLRDVLSSHDRSNTDLQMLDRLSAGLVTLPPTTYDLVLLLTDADGTRTESTGLLDRNVFTRIASSLRPNGKLESQDGTFGTKSSEEERTEAILSGLISAPDGGMTKPANSEAIPLRFGKKKNKSTAAVSDAGPAISTITTPPQLKRKSIDMTIVKPTGVGFVDFSNDFDDPTMTGDSDDEELIDESTLLTEEDIKRQVTVPPECVPRVGKRRRACKDCTCGLAQQLAAEDEVTRKENDAKLQTLKLGADDLAEVDFTVQGKVGSCGNCSLGDAFRCDGW